MMFPAYPGFEDLPLRVEVEWQGRTRPVVARLEGWPDSNRGVLVCTFEDDTKDGEWVVRQSSPVPYWVKETADGFWDLWSWGEDERLNKYISATKFDAEALEELRSNIKRAFKNDALEVARLFELPFARAPRIAMWAQTRSTWYDEWNLKSLTHFKLPQSLLQFNERQAREYLLGEWHDTSSDARFAWQWSQYHGQECLMQYSGIREYFTELERIMKLILIASTYLWQVDSYWLWDFTPWEEKEQLLDPSKASTPPSLNNRTSRPYLQSNLHLWNCYLLQSYTPKWKEEWIGKHECIGHTMKLKERANVRLIMNSPPTAHQQLEAKLALRDWLKGKATPEQIAQLMASLDD